MAKELLGAEAEDLLRTLSQRFAQNPERHVGLAWADIQARLEANSEKVTVLSKMEATGGEPDVVGRDAKTGEFLFVDCSPESPSGRRCLCYDQAALDARKEAKPRDSAVGMAADMGIELLDEGQYFALQKVGRFDTKTSSWIATPAEQRQLGGALFGDWRFGRVFIYHNGADSYYAARGFRGVVRV